YPAETVDDAEPRSSPLDNDCFGQNSCQPRNSGSVLKNFFFQHILWPASAPHIENLQSIIRREAQCDARAIRAAFGSGLSTVPASPAANYIWKIVLRKILGTEECKIAERRRLLILRHPVIRRDRGLNLLQLGAGIAPCQESIGWENYLLTRVS